MIKMPPYDVIFSDGRQEPPPYVYSIDTNIIRVSGDLIQRKILGFGDEIILDYTNDDLRQQKLLVLMLKLNSLGFAFSYDYKSYSSPSDYMKQLLCSGELTTTFKEISWKNQEFWLLTTYEYEKNITKT